MEPRRGIPFQDAAKAGLQFGDEGKPEKRTFPLHGTPLT